ncbi:MAG: XRE family transcriptional regulator [Clostridia bacterium]|nr:XRE family transcriptional regulator [Clostridia bacterium]
MSGKRKREEAVFQKLLRLADRKSNDAVRLAFLNEEDAEEIKKMELSALTELKRHANGAVEIKLVDRLAVYDRLCELTKRGGSEELEAFLNAAGGNEGT